MQAYVDDIVLHELGHLFFGFGLTKNKEGERQWFSLGLGLVYDREIWSGLYDRPSPLFSASVRVWQERFAWRKDIDQRLITPDTSTDRAASLYRHQSYDHGKAMVYLSELRQRIGKDRFDTLVREYIKVRVGETIQYDDFISRFTDSERILVTLLESEFQIR